MSHAKPTIGSGITERQRTIAWLTDAVKDHEELTPIRDYGDFGTAFQAIKSTISVLTFGDNIPDRTQHHVVNVLMALYPQLTQIEHEYEDLRQRFQKTLLELETLKEQQAIQ